MISAMLVLGTDMVADALTTGQSGEKVGECGQRVALH